MEAPHDILPFPAPSVSAVEVTDTPRPPAVPVRFIGWTLTVLFITVAFVADALVLTWVNRSVSAWPQPATLLGMSLVFAQMGLVSLACGFGRQHFLFRTLFFLLTAATAGMVGCRCIGRPEFQGPWIVMMLVHGTTVLIGVWIMRIGGWQLQLTGERRGERVSPWQFSLARLFALTTSAAIVLGIVQRLSVERDSLPQVSLVGTILGGLPIVVGLLMLTRRRLIAVAFFSSCTVAVSTCLFQLQIGPGQTFGAFFVVMLQELLLLAGLAIVRLAGYHLARTGRTE